MALYALSEVSVVSNVLGDELIDDGHYDSIDRTVLGDWGLTGCAALAKEYNLSYPGPDSVGTHDQSTRVAQIVLDTPNDEELESFQRGDLIGGHHSPHDPSEQHENSLLRR